MSIIKFLLLIVFVLPSFSFSETLVMGYRESAREPLIGPIGDNKGLYYDIYSLAAKRLGVTLEIVRYPKKRILVLIKEGKVDFYPGFRFTEERTSLVYYLENGILDGGDIGLSRMDFPTITDLHQLKNKKVLVSRGGATSDLVSKIDGIKLHTVSKLDVKKATQLIHLKRDDFYIYNKKSILYYLKKNNINNMKLHPNCCGKEKPMYLAFSRNSKHFDELISLDFDELSKVSILNNPTRIKKESLAYKLYLVLKQMKDSGEIDKLSNKYYK